MTEGGDGGLGYKHTDETKKKMRKIKLGNKLTNEHKNKISESVKIKAKENPNYNKCFDKTHYIDKDDLYQKYIIENLSLNKCASHFNVSKKTIFSNISEYGFKKDKSKWVNQLISSQKRPFYNLI